MVFTITKNIVITNNGDKCSVWKQYFMAFLVNLPFFTQGVESTALSSSIHSGHFVSSGSEVPWSTTALVISSAVSAPLSCYLADRCGRRAAFYAISLAQGASCIPLFLPPTEISTILLHILSGLSTGCMYTVLPPYVTEISSNIIRAETVTAMMAFTTLGYLTKIFMEDEAIMFLMVVLVAAQFLSLLVLIESPSYLIMIGKDEVAKMNIANLKCLPEDSLLVSNEVTLLKTESDRAKSKGKLNVLILWKNTIFRDTTKIGITLSTVLVFCGSIVFLDQDKSLMQLRNDPDPNKTLVLSCMCVGSLTTLGVVRFVERKVIAIAYLILNWPMVIITPYVSTAGAMSANMGPYLLYSSFLTMSLSMGVFAIYTQDNLMIFETRWAPVVSFAVLVFAYGVAWGLSILIMVEMLTFEIRAMVLAILCTYSRILKLFHVHTFKYIEYCMGLHTLFYIFAGANLFGAVYTLFAVPLLKRRSVRQIERQMKRIPLLVFNNKEIKI